MEQHLIKLLITIVDRGKGAKAAALYRSEHLYFNYICLGLGTANSEILDYFGLSETQKDVVFTPAPAVKLHSVMKKAGEHFRIMHLMCSAAVRRQRAYSQVNLQAGIPVN